MLSKFIRDERGATALEEALVTAFVALAVIAVMGVAGLKIVGVFFDAALRLSEESTGGQI